MLSTLASSCKQALEASSGTIAVLLNTGPSTSGLSLRVYSISLWSVALRGKLKIYMHSARVGCVDLPQLPAPLKSLLIYPKYPVLRAIGLCQRALGGAWSLSQQIPGDPTESRKEKRTPSSHPSSPGQTRHLNPLGNIRK